MANLLTEEHSDTQDYYEPYPHVMELVESDIVCPEGCMEDGVPVSMRVYEQGHFGRGDDTVTTLVCPHCFYNETE